MEFTSEELNDIRKWVKALRSGDYTQTRSCLQDDQGFCCLGVACDMFIDDSKKEYKQYKYLRYDLPSEQSNAPDWLKNIEDYDFPSMKNTSACTTIPEINDSGRTFNEIADLIENEFLK